MKKILSFFACLMFVLSINTSAQTTYHLKKGSNWFSTTVATDLESLKEALGTSGVSIVSHKDGFLTYEAGVWTGSLASFDNAQMYVINVSQDVDIVLDGNKIKYSEHPITLKQGWNWIGGADADFNGTLDLAFDSFNPEAGDIVKSLNSFSVFVNGVGWVGELKAINDGNGYKYYSKSGSDKEIVYHESYKLKGVFAGYYIAPSNLIKQKGKYRFAENAWDSYGTYASATQIVDMFLYGSYGGSLPKPEGSTEDWFIPSVDQWRNILFNRTTSSGIRYVAAQVNNINGLIIVPDNWIKSLYNFKSTNPNTIDYNTNIISKDTWMNTLEPAGCVFLPCSGLYGNAIYNNTSLEIGISNLYYWTSTKSPYAPGGGSGGKYYYGLYAYGGSNSTIGFMDMYVGDGSGINRQRTTVRLFIKVNQ